MTSARYSSGLFIPELGHSAMTLAPCFGAWRSDRLRMSLAQPAVWDQFAFLVRNRRTDLQHRLHRPSNLRFNRAAISSHMAYVGGDYQVSKDLSQRAYHAEVADLYQ